MIIFVSHRFHWFTQILPSEPLDYSSAEFKRIPLRTRILFFLNTNRTNLFIAHGSHESHRSFPSGPLDYSIRTVNPCPSVCPKNLEWYSSDSCSKKICVHLCAKNIRAIRAIRVQRKNPCPSVSIRVPKTFDSCSKKQSAQVPHTNAEPRRTTFILSVMPGDYHSRLPTRPLPLLLYITSQPSCHSQYTYHEASCWYRHL